MFILSFLSPVFSHPFSTLNSFGDAVIATSKLKVVLPLRRLKWRGGAKRRNGGCKKGGEECVW